MNEFEQKVVSALAILETEMREVRKTLECVAAMDRKVITLEHEIGSLRAESKRSQAEHRAEVGQLKADIAEVGGEVKAVGRRVEDLTIARRDIQTGLRWSAHTLQWIWRVASFIGGGILAWLAK